MEIKSDVCMHAMFLLVPNTVLCCLLYWLSGALTSSDLLEGAFIVKPASQNGGYCAFELSRDHLGHLLATTSGLAVAAGFLL